MQPTLSERDGAPISLLSNFEWQNLLEKIRCRGEEVKSFHRRFIKSWQTERRGDTVGESGGGVKVTHAPKIWKQT